MITVRSELDFEDPQPLYEQLAEVLRGQINDGTIKANRAIPPQRDLCAQHHVARGTVSRAIGILIAEGLLQTSKGKGVFVVPRPPRQPPES